MCYAPSRCFCSRKICIFCAEHPETGTPYLVHSDHLPFFILVKLPLQWLYWAKGFGEGEEKECFFFPSSSVFFFEQGFFLSFLQWLKLSMKRFPSLQILSSSWSLNHFMPASEGRKQDTKRLFLMPRKQCSFSRGKTGCKGVRDVERNGGRIRRKETVVCDEKLECAWRLINLYLLKLELLCFALILGLEIL